LLSIESELFSGWQSSEITVVSSLEEPWIAQFGAESIRGLMQKMGMKEDEVLSHSMITSAIQNAQKKLDKSVTSEMKANSMEEWFRLNHQE
jgi:preprotein translocase subunit SecA